MSQSNPLFVEQYFAGGDGGARQQTQKFLADANKASNINKSQKGFYNATVEFGIMETSVISGVHLVCY